MGNITYVNDKNGRTIWVRSRSGEPVSVGNTTESVVIKNEWIAIQPSSSVLSLILKLNKLIAVSETDPNIKVEKPILKKLNVKETEVNLIQGNKFEFDVTPEPAMELPAQLIAISSIMHCASAAVKDKHVTITAHRPGNTVLTCRSGNVEVDIKVNVYPVPEFVKKFYETEVNKPVELAIKGQNEFKLTLPDASIKQDGHKVVASKAGDYEIVANILGKTISTTVRVTDPEAKEAAEE